MSDEPKRRSRLWIAWTAIALFVVYPLSKAPVCYLVDRLDCWETVAKVYAPADWVIVRWEPVHEAMHAWAKLWYRRRLER
jgi:hypothetical protein